MTGTEIDIGWIELFASTSLMLVAAVVSLRLRLGVTKSIVISTIRGFLQLFAMALVLVYLFQYQSWWLVGIVLICMTVFATQIATSRVKGVVVGIWPSVYATLLVSGILMALITVEGVIKPDPWFSARQLVPITGMSLGNSATAAAIAIERLFSDLDFRQGEILALTAMGATPREAAMPSLKRAIVAGITPSLASLSAAGIVQIPGTMSGQILSGADPIMAAKYQILVLMLASAATTVAMVIMCFHVYKKRFSAEGYFLEPGIRQNSIR